MSMAAIFINRKNKRDCQMGAIRAINRALSDCAAAALPRYRVAAAGNRYAAAMTVLKYGVQISRAVSIGLSSRLRRRLSS